MATVAGASLARYRLIEKIGEGGMGAVWRALDTTLDREIAVKVLLEGMAADPDRVARFEREARVLAALNHPNIVVIHSVEEAEGRHFLTMELVRGRPLSDLLPATGLPIDRLLELAIPIADALDAAHRSGIVHGDLKPANIAIGDDGRLKVLDFGLARACRSARAVGPDSRMSTATLDDAGAISGTVPYMSPEQIEGKPLDARSDIFSAGTLLYEMATGIRPFRGATAPVIFAAILRDTPRRVDEVRPELPRQIGRIVARCLEKDPEARYASAADLRRALDQSAPRAGTEEEFRLPSIAILPFADVSAEHDQDYFCEGLADEIINAISQIEGLRVASRTSSFQFRNAALDSREIGDRLGVGHLLEGSVRKAGGRLRITARLVGVADGCQLWSRTYDRDLKDVFAIQEEIAQAIVDALEVTLSPKDRRALRQVATADVHAYEHYLRARKYFYLYDRRGVECALQMFSRAIAKDPAYARAWAGIADCHTFLYQNAGHAGENRRQADAASLKALELDPLLAEAHASRGQVLALEGRNQESEESFRTAIRLNPRLFEAWYFHARQAFAAGNKEEAVRLYEKASEVRPDDYQSPLLVAQIYDDQGRPEEARAARRRGVRLAETRLEFTPDDVRALYMAANGLVMLGERDRAIDWTGRALRIEPDDPMLLYNSACVYALAGELEPAIDCLERAVAGGMAFLEWIEHDSNLDPLRGLARFRALIDRLRTARGSGP